MHYAPRAAIFGEKKTITKCLTLEIDFSANFHLIHDFFDEALFNFPKIEEKKTKKREGGTFHG